MLDKTITVAVLVGYYLLYHRYSLKHSLSLSIKLIIFEFLAILLQMPTVERSIEDMIEDSEDLKMTLNKALKLI